MSNKKYTDLITIFELSNMDSIELLCNALEKEAVINIMILDGISQIKVLWKNEKFFRAYTNEEWDKKEFLKNASRGIIRIQRSLLKSDFQNLSDTQIDRKLGDTSLALTMTEMSEDGKDIWG